MKTRIFLLTIILTLMAAPSYTASRTTDPFNEGVRLFNDAHYEQAIPRLEAAVKQKPNDVVRRLTYGIALSTIREYDEAIKQFLEVSKMLPQDPVPYFLLEGVYQASGQVANAQLAHTNANNKLLGKQQIGTVSMGRPSGDTLSDKLSKHPHNSVAQNLLGDICQMRRQYTSAIGYYRKATELAPKWTKAWFNLGIAELKVNPDGAIEDFKRVIELDPENKQAQLWLGDALAAAGDLKNGLRAYENAAKAKDLEATARSRIGNLYLKQNQPRQAEREFRQAQTQAPHDPTNAVGLGDALSQQYRLDESVEEYQKASTLTKSDPTRNSVVTPNLANAFIEKGEYQKAIEELKRSIALNPVSPDLYKMLVDAYSRGHILQQGIDEYTDLLKKEPNNVIAVQFLVVAYAVSNDSDGRAMMARKLLKKLPEKSDVWYRELGCALIARKDFDGALEAWKSGLATDPLVDSVGILKEAQSAGLLESLTAFYEIESAASKQDSPSLILANIYEYQNDFERAVEIRQKLVDRYPNKQHFWVLLGDDLVAVGRIPDAIDAYTKAVAMSDPSIAAIAEQRLKNLK